MGPVVLAGAESISPWATGVAQGLAGLGLVYLFYRVLRDQSKRLEERDREYERVKAERDEAIAEHRTCEELVDRLVGALRNAGITVPWTWKHTPPAPAAPLKSGRTDDQEREAP